MNKSVISHWTSFEESHLVLAPTITGAASCFSPLLRPLPVPLPVPLGLPLLFPTFSSFSSSDGQVSYILYQPTRIIMPYRLHICFVAGSC